MTALGSLSWLNWGDADFGTTYQAPVSGPGSVELARWTERQTPGSHSESGHCAVKRVLIIGCGGAGKSTLADALGQRTGLPVIPLDGHFWTPGWVKESPERWQAKSNEFADRAEWIMDGNYGSTMERRLERADTAILIDRAPLLCLWRVFRRRLKWSGKVRPGLPDGCVERLSLEFAHYILTWRLLRLPGVLKRLEGARERGVDVHVLRSDAEIKTFLDSVS